MNFLVYFKENKKISYTSFILICDLSMFIDALFIFGIETVSKHTMHKKKLMINSNMIFYKAICIYCGKSIFSVGVTILLPFQE